jgi:hypothetical protein
MSPRWNCQSKSSEVIWRGEADALSIGVARVAQNNATNSGVNRIKPCRQGDDMGVDFDMPNQWKSTKKHYATRLAAKE